MGLNFYKPRDRESFGFILNYHPRKALRVRYSKTLKQWIVRHISVCKWKDQPQWVKDTCTEPTVRWW